MTPNIQTDVLLVGAIPFQIGDWSKVGNVICWKFIWMPIKYSSCIYKCRCALDVITKWITYQQEVHVPFLIAIFEEKLFFTSVSNNIPFPFKGLRTPEERVQFLRNVPTEFNVRLEAPLRNLKTQADAGKEYPEEFQAFLDNYEPLRKARGELGIANLRQ